MKKKPSKKAPSLTSPFKNSKPKDNAKIQELKINREDSSNQFLTTNQGLKINDNQNSLKAGERGGTLLEDFILREKITHFDHERIPERIVHARGSGAHGYFQVYESMAKYTTAKFLQDPGHQTPVFVRFSTVAGSRGSTDLARDVRGFAVKFYTEEGNYDLVGNNMPVFFIQDAIKFPDLIHAVKPEPHNEMPQAASAHDTFWDFISLMPESMHMIMWAMSDRAIPRSLRMMEGFGIHTFRFINEQGKAHFVKFHWKPLLGMHSVMWDEALKISGKDPDFHRRDLWEAIENGDYPEWEFGVQLIPEADEHKFDFDLLDPTKLIPEELVPVRRIGKLTLNRNPDNFFAETEQVAFHPGHIVPGIDFTNDPLLQGRLFSYTDTQLKRLGSPNFHEIPINRPINQIHNNQRDGHMRQMINQSRTSYEPNTLGKGFPQQASTKMGGFASYAEKIDATKIRGRSKSFFDHFSQAALFYNSQSETEKLHIVKALRFELGKLETDTIKERMLYLLAQVDKGLANQVSETLGIKVPAKLATPVNQSIPADASVKDNQPLALKKFNPSPALSMANTIKTAKTRKVAVLIADGFAAPELNRMIAELKAEGIQAKIIATRGGLIKAEGSETVKADATFSTAGSVLFDAVYVPGGKKSIDILLKNPDAILFINETYKHCKAISATGMGIELLQASSWAKGKNLNNDKEDGVVAAAAYSKAISKSFIDAVAAHRFWNREKNDMVPA